MLVVGLFSSYVLAVLLWGMLHSVVKIIEPRMKIDFDSETFICMPPKELADKYEVIKKADSLCGNRITKLKAEIHMATTLIAGGIALIVAYLAVPKSLNYVLASLLLIWGAIGALIHFRSRLANVLKCYPYKDIKELLERIESEQVNPADCRDETPADSYRG